MYLAYLFLTLGSDPQLEWRNGTDGDHSHVFLFRGPRQVGAYSHKTDLYYPLCPDTGKFLDPCPAPIPVPERRNFGVRLSEISVEEKITISGNKSTIADAFFALTNADTRIPPSSQKYRIVVVGNGDDASKHAEQIKACLSEEEKNSTIVQAYQVTDWQAKQAGFAPDGKLTAYFLSPDGKELIPPSNLSEGVNAWVEATRVKRPDYRPLLPNKGGRILDKIGSAVLPWSVAGGLVLVLIVRKLFGR